MVKINFVQAYREILNGKRFEDTHLDTEALSKLRLFMEYFDSDILQTELRKKTGLSKSTIYKLRKVYYQHKNKL